LASSSLLVNGAPMLHALFAAFWFLIFGAFLVWVLFILPPRERRPGDDDDAELPRAA
jgi:hypothetical protein